MADAVQWTVDQMFGQLDKIRAGAAVERAQISMNNAHLIDLNAQADEIGDPSARAQLKAWIGKSVAHQGEIANAYRALSGNFANLAAKAEAWLRSVGINSSVPGLAGLGVAWVVPVAIIALAVTALAAVLFIHELNAAQVKAIALHQDGLNALVHGGATPAQVAAYIANADASAQAQWNAAKKNAPDPFGISHLVDSLLPIALVAAVVLLAPRMMQRRAA